MAEKPIITSEVLPLIIVTLVHKVGCWQTLLADSMMVTNESKQRIQIHLRNFYRSCVQLELSTLQCSRHVSIICC